MRDIYSIRRENFDRLLASPRVQKIKLQKDRQAHFGVSSPSMWAQLRKPTYKIGDPMARGIEQALGLPTGWMDSDAHHPQREVNVKIQGGGPGLASRFGTLDDQILAVAETWVRIEEGSGREFQPVRRLQRKLEIAEMIRSDGGILSDEHTKQLLDAASKGEWDGASTSEPGGGS